MAPSVRPTVTITRFRAASKRTRQAYRVLLPAGRIQDGPAEPVVG